jgi:hypothetical protein
MRHPTTTILLAGALCLRMAHGHYTQLAQPITGAPLCVNDTGACQGCVGVQTDYGHQLATKKARHQKAHHGRGYQRG